MSPIRDRHRQADERLGRAIRNRFVARPGSEQARAHLSAMLAADRERRTAPVAARVEPATGRRTAVVGVIAAALALPLLGGGLAVAGVSLPDPARDAFEAVGISLPNQAEENGKSDQSPRGEGTTGPREPAAAAFGRCLSEAARAGDSNPARSCAELHPGRNDGAAGNGGGRPESAGERGAAQAEEARSGQGRPEGAPPEPPQRPGSGRNPVDPGPPSVPQPRGGPPAEPGAVDPPAAASPRTQHGR